jgi:hypothetical protein
MRRIASSHLSAARINENASTVFQSSSTCQSSISAVSSLPAVRAGEQSSPAFLFALSDYQPEPHRVNAW